MQAQQRPKPFSPFQLGDIVLVDAHLGQIIGIRYGLIAYDVTGQDPYLPKRCARACPVGVVCKR